MNVVKGMDQAMKAMDLEKVLVRPSLMLSSISNSGDGRFQQ